MDKEELKLLLTKEQIIEIVKELGSGYKLDASGNPYFQTICHNHGGEGSWKLYYYDDIHSFRCFTECSEFFDIYKLVQKVKNVPFIQALNYVQNFFGFGVRHRKGFTEESYDLTDDWDLINKYTDYHKILQREDFEHDVVPEGILSLFDDVYPVEWLNEGIGKETLDLFNIKMDLNQKQIIIPHYDTDSNLIGIRCRNLDDYKLKYLGMGKYMPIYLQNHVYSHNLSKNLYGYNITKDAIRRIKKIALWESEKSVQKCQEFYGENNFSVALCGHSLSKEQKDLILNSGATEVFFCLDRDYTDENSEEGKKCAESILKECYKLSPYITTYLLWDTDELNLLGYKDAPCDRGKDVLETLMKNKYEVFSKEGEKSGRKRKATRVV